MTDQYSKHVAYVITVCNEVVVLKCVVEYYIACVGTSWWLCSEIYGV